MGQLAALDFGAAPGDHCRVTNILSRARFACAFALLVLPVGLVTRDLGAQEIGLYRAGGTTDLTELGALQGLGGYFRVTPLRYLSLRLNVYRHKADAIQRQGLVCNNYVLEFMCDPEQIENASQLQGASLAAALRVPAGKRVEFELGAGVSLNEISASERTQSGRPSLLVYGKSAQAGVLGRASLRVQPFLSTPVIVDMSYDVHQLSMTGCSTDVIAYAPYCGSAGLREWRVGLGYRIQ